MAGLYVKTGGGKKDKKVSKKVLTEREWFGNIDKLSDESGHEELERKTEKNKKSGWQTAQKMVK